MSTLLTLDFGKIRESEEQLPDIGVADFIPFKEDGQVKVLPRKGIILQLNDSKSLKAGVELPAGAGLLYVRLPTGETLVERIKIEPTLGQLTGRLSLKISKAEKPLRFSDSFSSAYAPASSGTSVDYVRPASGNFDRSRWSTVTFTPPKKRPRWTPPPRLSSFLEPFAKQVVRERQGNRGIAKLQSSAGTFAPISSKPKSSIRFDSKLVGQVQAAKPVKLYGSRNELHTQWKTPLSKTLRKYSSEEQGERYFALSFEAVEEPMPLQLACVPGRWRTLSGEFAQLNVQYVADHTRAGQQGQRVVVGVDDPKFRALLQFMQTGDLASSVSLLDQAAGALYDKLLNPYAAAAGGYVLTYAGYHDWRHNWGLWLYNLATNFPALPDGHILLANLILQGPKAAKEEVPGYSHTQPWELALSSVLESVRRGPPMYRFGLRMLSSSIAILNHLVDKKHRERQRLDAAADYVRDLSMRVDRHQPFCVFDVGRNAP